ncbi:MAG: ABC transporter substrate-binding protein [Halovenus sp.]|uniref:ABC transporter substrate-binding protein n=1 Tax=Halovenus amylolytica TaxID=2500550 RepID=UPI000FE3DA1B
MPRISRREAIGALGTSGVIALAGCAGGGDDSGDDGENNTDGDSGGTTNGVSGNFKIGVLQDFSGVLPAYGAQGTTGFYSGLAYKADSDPLGNDAVDEGDYEYEVGDLTVELSVRDTQWDPSQAQQLAEDLATTQEVDLLYGVGNSNSANRVISQVVDRANIPYIPGPAASAAITNDSETCRDLVFRANENTAMDARSGGVYIAEETDVERVALFGADEAFGRSVVSNYRQVLENNGVEIVQQRFVPSDYAEWDGLLDQAEQADAQGMVGGFTASALVPFGRSFLQGDYDIQLFGGFASRVTLNVLGDTLSSTLGEDFTNEGLADAGFGPFTTRYHWNQYDNPINDAFIDMHTDTYEVVPDLFTSGAFTAASSVVQAIEQAGEASSDAVVNEMKGMTVADTPKGEDGYMYQEYNNQARSDMTIAPVEVTTEEGDDQFWPAAIKPGDPIETVPADQVTTPASEMSCDLS